MATKTMWTIELTPRQRSILISALRSLRVFTDLRRAEIQDLIDKLRAE